MRRAKQFQLTIVFPVSMTPGTTIRVPAGTKHWHGAKADSWFSHIAFIPPGSDVSNEWLNPVTDDEYAQLLTQPSATNNA